MSATGRTAGPSSPDAVAAALAGADFVRLAARADGDALAAAGLLARAVQAAGVPFQASVAATDAERADALAGADAAPDDAVAVSVGAAFAGEAAALDGGEADHVLAGDGPTSAAAAAVAREVAPDGLAPADHALGLAGVVAAGEPPAGRPLEDARAAGAVERRPGVATPTDDAADLAASTLVHGPFSGRPDAAAALRAAAEDAAADADDPEAARRRRLASLVAVGVAGADGASGRAADAVETALRPLATPAGPFATVGGHADVLDGLARAAPGTGLALALGGDVRDAAPAAWREHAAAAHDAVRDATTGRYDGLLAARVDDGPVATPARLLAAYRSPEPVALVATDGAAAVAAPGGDAPLGALRAAATDLGGAAGPLARGGYAAFDGDADAFVTAFREASER